jgi:two-component system sensor histidine kinase YesM
MKNQKHSYFKDDIRRMLLFYAIVPVVLLTLACLLIFWGIWSYTIRKSTREENRIVTEEISATINAYTNLIHGVEEHQEVYDGILTIGTRVAIFEQIYKTANALDKKANLYVFNDSMEPVLTSTTKVPEYLNGRYSGNWGIFRVMKQNPDKIAIKLLQENDSENMQMVIGKAMQKDGKINGYTTFVIDSGQFKVYIAKMASQTVITDENGWVFVTNNYNFMDTLERFDLKVEKSNSSISSGESRYFVSLGQIRENRILIYSISNLSNQILILKYIVFILLFVFTALIIFVLINSKQMAVNKTKDLYTIIDTFARTKAGDLDTHIYISGNDEFRTIAEAYNQMLDSLKEQIERNKEMSKLVAQSQIKQLQSQFNPHFLFNTLENIRFMCKLHPDSASKMVQNLSTLLRYSISNTREEVTVKEDIAYTENYLSLLKYRFNQRFQYDIDISPEIEDCIIPKLLVQPMIENSIKYGFEDREHLVVEITGYREEDNLVVICTDDGIGITPGVLEEIRQILGSSSNRSSHTGLYNINRRLQLRYGEAYGIRIESERGKGTSLKVILPMCYEEIQAMQSQGGKDA